MQEGWAPTAFKSSHSSRAALLQQQATDFMDDDELAEIKNKGLRATGGFDTFAAAATADAQRQAEVDAARRHGPADSSALNLFPEEAIRPVQLSVGMQLLQKMGWRPVLPFCSDALPLEC
jgi:hypothetical protein